MGFIGDALQNGIMGVLLTLDTIIYSLISSAFKVFMAIADARLLSSDAYTEIANKVYVIVGVLMLFVLAYSLLRAIIDPDKGLKEALGPKLVKSVITAVIGLAITPVLFNLMYQAQGLILEQDVLSKLFFRSSTSETMQVPNGGGSIVPDEEIDNVGGAVTATTIWQAFFHPANDKPASEISVSFADYAGSILTSGLLCAGALAGTILAGIASFGTLALLGAGASVAACASLGSNVAGGVAAAGDSMTLEQAYYATSSGESFSIYCAFLTKYTKSEEIEYFWGVSTIAGAFTLYAFISFSIDMGIRAAKLAYLQIIAPIPLVMQVMPGNDKRLGNYVKAVVSTFMEVFIRITVVYVVVYIICHLQDLFSSTGALWGNDDLNSVEKLFAMTFLILGLIAFCKTAPGFLSEALGLNKGTMEGMGLKPSDFRKKLADGGLFAGRAIADGGARSAVRNWNKARSSGKNVASSALSALGGLGSGAVRAGMMGIGPEKIDTWRKAGDAAERASQAAEAARDKRAERQEQHAMFTEALNKANKENEKAIAEEMQARTALDALINSGNYTAAEEQAARARLDAAKKAVEAAAQKLQKARADAWKTTAVGAQIQIANDKAVAWAVGTISTQTEEAAMKFGSTLDSLKGKLRDEAYAKDEYGAQALKNQYEALKSQPLREYVDGWDEQSANEEYRRRRADLQQHSNTLGNLRRQMIAPGVTDAQYQQLKTAYEAEEAALRQKALVNNWDIEIGGDGSITNLDSVDLIADIKIDSAKARAERASQLEGLRIAMEAAADAWAQDKAANDPKSKVRKYIDDFLSENYEYINKNQNTQIVVGYTTDANGNEVPIKETLAEAIARGFGDEAVNGKFVPNDVFKSQTSFDVELKQTLSFNGGTYKKIKYKLDASGDNYVPYGVDANGNEVDVSASSEFSTCRKEDFFENIRSKIVAGKVKKADAKTAVAVAADKGKTSAAHIRRTDYADKIQRKRQVEDAKKGGK